MDKLKGIPTVYYTNLDRRHDRKQYMEDQFKKYEIPFVRVVLPPITWINNPPKEFLDLLTGNYTSRSSMLGIWLSSHVIQFFNDWINETNDPYLIYMEDDYDLSLIDRWHFTWNELMERLPYDWDNVLLGFESPDIIPFYLHPTSHKYSLGPCLLRREYLKKLIGLFFVNNKFKFDHIIRNDIYIDRETLVGDNKTYEMIGGSADYFVIQSGNSYSLPLLLNNPYFQGLNTEKINGDNEWFPKLSFVKSWEAYYDWWTYDRDKFTLDDFFTYGKDNDILMQRDITRWDDKYFYHVGMKHRKKYAQYEKGILSRGEFIKNE